MLQAKSGACLSVTALPRSAARNKAAVNNEPNTRGARKCRKKLDVVGSMSLARLMLIQNNQHHQTNLSRVPTPEGLHKTVLVVLASP